MTFEFQEILEELYQDDPTLKDQEEKLLETLSQLKSQAPNPPIDQAFKAELKRKIELQFFNNSSKKPPTSFAFLFTMLFSSLGFLIFWFFIIKQIIPSSLDTFQWASSPEISTNMPPVWGNHWGMNLRSADSAVKGDSSSDWGMLDSLGDVFGKEEPQSDAKMQDKVLEGEASWLSSESAPAPATLEAPRTKKSLKKDSESSTVRHIEPPTALESTDSIMMDELWGWISTFSLEKDRMFPDKSVWYTYTGNLVYPSMGEVYQVKNTDSEMLFSTLWLSSDEKQSLNFSNGMAHFTHNSLNYEINSNTNLLNITNIPTLAKSSSNTWVSLPLLKTKVDQFFSSLHLSLNSYTPPQIESEFSNQISLSYQMHLNGSKVYDINGEPVWMKVTLDAKNGTVLSVLNYCYAIPQISATVPNISQQPVAEVLNKGWIQNLLAPQEPTQFEPLSKPELAYVAYTEKSTQKFQALYPALSFEKPNWRVIVPLTTKIYQFDAQGRVIDTILTK